MEPLESDMIKGLRKGDRVFFEELFTTHYPSLLLLAQKILHETSAAEDVVHHVFLQLWEKREKLQIKESLTAYLGKAVRNACMNYLKHQKVEENYNASFLLKVSEEELSTTPSAILIGQEQVTELKKSIDQLPDKCGQVFKLSRFFSMSNKEIAVLLDISVRTVENQIYRALKILKEQVSNSD